MKKEVSTALLKKYLDGECTPEEEAIVNEWYDSFEGNASDKTIYEFIPEDLEEKVLNNIKSRIRPFRNTPTVKSRNFRRIFLAAASVSLFLLATGWFAYAFWMKDAYSRSDAFATVRNSTNTIQRVSLHDGSVIWLKPNSEIVYEKEFSPKERRLKLIGEAFFVVAKDPTRPFSIATNKVVTQVLGTSFNIKAYDESSSIEVEVLTGKVSVKVADVSEAENQGVLLTPHEKATYNKAENQLKKLEPEKLEANLAIWKASNFSFDNAPVRDVIKALDSAFDVKIQTSNVNLLNCQIRADFTDQNLPDILELLSKSIEASYEVRGDTFFLIGEGCSN